MKPIPLNRWGKDHWSTLAFIETLCVDHKGLVSDSARTRMRCNPKRHPGYGYNLRGSGDNWRPEWGTRLKGFFEQPDNSQLRLVNHDDWDCVEDMEAAGVLENQGSGMNPQFVLTPLGVELASALRKHKMGGGSFASFNPTNVATKT